MRFRTFLVTGVEVLHAGGERWQSNAWPASHWRANKGRWRLSTSHIDDFLQDELKANHYGGPVEGCVVVLEIADFDSWSPRAFVAGRANPSFKRSTRDLWCYAKLNWLDIQHLTLKQQYAAYCEAMLAAAHSLATAKRMPKGFSAEPFESDLAAALAKGKPSRFTYAANANAV